MHWLITKVNTRKLKEKKSKEMPKIELNLIWYTLKACGDETKIINSSQIKVKKLSYDWEKEFNELNYKIYNIF